MPVTVARKQCHKATKQTLQTRSRQNIEQMNITSGESSEAMLTRTGHMVKSLDRDTREAIISGMNRTITVPHDQVAAMKRMLNLPWNLLRDVRRWLQTFDVKLASESKTRDILKEWNGNGLRC